jgi:hypothetical protein
LFPDLKAWWIRNADSGRGRRFVSAALDKRFHIVLDAAWFGAPLPALGVRVRTVGDFFCGPSVHREGGARRSVKDFHWKWGLLRSFG